MSLPGASVFATVLNRNKKAHFPSCSVLFDTALRGASATLMFTLNGITEMRVNVDCAVARPFDAVRFDGWDALNPKSIEATPTVQK